MNFVVWLNSIHWEQLPCKPMGLLQTTMYLIVECLDCR